MRQPVLSWGEVNMEKLSLDEKMVVYLDKFDEMLEDPQQDHTRLLNEILKIVVVLMRTSAKIDKNYALDREVEIWAHVEDVKGTFNSKKVLYLTIASGLAIGFSGIVIGLSAIPGTTLGNALANTKFSFLSGVADIEGKRINTIGSAIGQIGQGIGLFPKISDEINQSERNILQHKLEEAKQKRQDRKDAHQRHTQHHERSLQHSRDNAEKESRAKSEVMRGVSA